MKKKEKSYIVIFDKHKNFKEIRVLSESSDPFVVNQKSVGDSIYIYTQKEFAKLIESTMRHIAEPVGEANNSHADENDMFENIGQQVVLPDGNIGYIKSVKDGSTNKKDLGEYRSDGKTACTLTGGVDINPKIGI